MACVQERIKTMNEKKKHLKDDRRILGKNTAIEAVLENV